MSLLKSIEEECKYHRTDPVQSQSNKTTFLTSADVSVSQWVFLPGRTLTLNPKP
jgi:hypothetical protein